MLEASYHDQKEEASKPVLSPKVAVQSSAPLEQDLLPRDEKHVEPPKVKRKEEFQPLRQEQLNSLYYNAKLETNTAFIDRFVQVRY